LGPTLAQIAYEKSGIFKAGVPVVCAPQPDEAAAVLRATAAERSCPLIELRQTPSATAQPHTYSIGPTDPQLRGQALTYAGEPYHAALSGPHQATNAAVALAVVEQFCHMRALPPLSADARRAGLAAAFIPARVEVLTFAAAPALGQALSRPLLRTADTAADAPLVLLDGAHTTAAAQMLAETLKACTLHAGRRTLVFGAKHAKDVGGMLRALLPLFTRVILTQAGDPPTAPPAALAEVAAAIATELGYNGEIQTSESLANSLALAWQDGGRGMVCVTGSLYVVGAARDLLGRPPARP
jgi:dihydrofolate synthase / folylpolyglutamate synthase